MDAISTRPKVLFLSRPDRGTSAVVTKLLAEAELRSVTTFDEAVAALREGTYDLVVSDTSDFLALERATVKQQAGMILETIGQGVCIVDLNGRLVWANPKMRSYPSDLLSQVCDACVRRLTKSGEQDAGQAMHSRTRRFSLMAGDDQHFETTISPVMDSGGRVTHLAAVVWDVTQSRRLQKKIDAIDLAGRELVRLDAAKIMNMNIEDRLAFLEEKIVRYMRELLEYDNFAVLLLDRQSNRLEMVIQHGMSEKSKDSDIFASPENNGISGYVAATGRSYICHDTSKDPRYLTGLEHARSSLTVPLRLHDAVIGVLNIESEQPAAFDEDDRQFTEILARYVAIAVNFLELLVTEQNVSRGRVANDFSAEIAGPLNDIITEASTLMEEYIGHDDLRHRLATICDRVAEIRVTVKEMGAMRTVLLGSHDVPARTDPLLEGKWVLVADDQDGIRETISKLLSKCGCEVHSAADGDEAIGRLQERKYDLLLADIKMPKKSGYEVFAAAKTAHPDIAVILMTGFGYDPNHSIVRARREGLNAVLFKPFKVDQLLGEVRQALQPRT
jgi:two-component system, sensor histidine kinase SagS